MAANSNVNLLRSISDSPQNAANPTMTTHYDPALIYANLENFELNKKIGKGQFSEVYRAYCPLTGEMVALKKIQVI